MDRVYFTKLRDYAIIPSKREEDAGYDIFACIETPYIKIPAFATMQIPTGLASAFSTKFYFQLHERGSTGIMGISQRSGVIDSGYRGEWFVPITNLNSKSLYIVRETEENAFKPEDPWEDCIVINGRKAICQAILLPVPKVEIVEVSGEEIAKWGSLRGEGCLGSSRK